MKSLLRFVATVTLTGFYGGVAAEVGIDTHWHPGAKIVLCSILFLAYGISIMLVWFGDRLP